MVAAVEKAKEQGANGEQGGDDTGKRTSDDM